MYEVGSEAIVSNEEKIIAHENLIDIPIHDDLRIRKPRLNWSSDLRTLFLQAVHHLGGPKTATPKAILDEMGIDGLTRYHVKSHLQKFRKHLRLGRLVKQRYRPQVAQSPLSDGSSSSNSAMASTLNLEGELLDVQVLYDTNELPSQQVREADHQGFQLAPDQISNGFEMEETYVPSNNETAPAQVGSEDEDINLLPLMEFLVPSNETAPAQVDSEEDINSLPLMEFFSPVEDFIESIGGPDDLFAE